IRRLHAPTDALARGARARRAARGARVTAEMSPAVAAAYDHCDELTRRAASNFAWAFRLLPGERRRALSAVYAFCRSADDLTDEPGHAPDVPRLLARWREEL